MKKLHPHLLFSVFLAIILLLAGCQIFQDKQNEDAAPQEQNESEHPIEETENPNTNTEEDPNQNGDAANEEEEKEDDDEHEPVPPIVYPTDYDEEAIEVVADPDDIAVLVNKHNRLPENYEPADLVEPNVQFLYDRKDRRKLRKVAAEALEEMFAAAEKDGIYLAAVSGYRSEATQEVLYNNYVDRDGQEAADRYSARPGHSEHQTGLTMDVSGANGKCAVQDCFADTPEAKWIEENAHKFGFIVRYPKDKEHITGYKYEPWHIRYVGKEIAQEIYEKQITLEEYHYYESLPVNE